MTYATIDDWAMLGENCPDNEQEAVKWLRQASRHIDTLTFNRIVERGFENLTDFQWEIVTEVTCRLARWEWENADLLDSPLSGYSINGVSAQFGTSEHVTSQDGVLIPRQLYGLLQQTGLCCRRL